GEDVPEVVVVAEAVEEPLPVGTDVPRTLGRLGRLDESLGAQVAGAQAVGMREKAPEQALSAVASERVRDLEREIRPAGIGEQVPQRAGGASPFDRSSCGFHGTSFTARAEASASAGPSLAGYR